MANKKKRLTEVELSEVVSRFDVPTVVKSDAYLDGGTDPLWPRFERSVGNQMENGGATLSRYAIWANTVRDNVLAGMNAMSDGDEKLCRYYLIRAANSLSAFSEVQATFDPLS